MALEGMDVRSLVDIDTKLNQIKDLDLLLENVLLEARRVVNADAGSIYINEALNNEGEKKAELAIKYTQNETTQKHLPPGQKPIYSFFTFPIDYKTISGYCALTQQLVNVPDAYNLAEGVPFSFNKQFDLFSGYKTISVLAVPLKSAEGKLLGVIQVFNSKDKDGNTVPFSANDEVLISHFAINASVALQKAQIMNTMILRMIKMAELRDPKETGSHVNRVAGYAAEIFDCWAGKREEWNREKKNKYIDNLRIASKLHDVGKVAISDTILKKPARFTPEEYLIMQSHTVIGSAIFGNPQSLLDEMSRDIALTHHENWDGTGYPGWVDPVSGAPQQVDKDNKVLGKKGSEIPVEGQIVSIADVYDALCSRRVYKEPWKEENVLEEIRNLSGTKFNHELVDVFFEILPNIKNVQARFPEDEP